MAYTATERLKNAWNAFMNRDPPDMYDIRSCVTVGSRPDRIRLMRGSEKSIVAPIYTKIAMDCASMALEHVRLDENGHYKETVNSKLNNCLTVNANKDQSARQFIQDVVMSMFDEGCIALPPIDTTSSVNDDGEVTYDIVSIRTARILEWMPDSIKMRAYNDRTGKYEDLILPKAAVPILENPLYAVMNENNSTVQRLIRTLNLSDTIDQQNGSGKLDMIIQLPYSIRSDSMKARAEDRRRDLENQLKNNKYGVAYADSSEKIIQLNRAIENNLYERVKYLWGVLYADLGITEEVMNGTATPEAMQNYYSRTVEPVVSCIVDGMKWKYISKSARQKGETIIMTRDPFRLLSPAAMADIADKFTRNEILSPNEVRQIVGRRPVKDSSADELRNRNINQNNKMIEDTPAKAESNDLQTADPNAKNESSPFDQYTAELENMVET